MLAALVVCFQFGHGCRELRGVQKHFYMFVACQLRQLDIRHSGLVLAGRKRLLAQCFSQGSCHLLQYIAAEISFSRQIREAIRQRQFVRGQGQAANLKGELFSNLRSLGIRQLAKIVQLPRDRLLPVAPEDFLFLPEQNRKTQARDRERGCELQSRTAVHIHHRTTDSRSAGEKRPSCWTRTRLSRVHAGYSSVQPCGQVLCWLWRAQDASVSAERDCVPPEFRLVRICSVNSFLPELADTGRYERSSCETEAAHSQDARAARPRTTQTTSEAVAQRLQGRRFSGN